MPKKNSFMMAQHGANRGSQGNDNMMFQSFNNQSNNNTLGGVHNRTSSGFNNGINR